MSETEKRLTVAHLLACRATRRINDQLTRRRLIPGLIVEARMLLGLAIEELGKVVPGEGVKDGRGRPKDASATPGLGEGSAERSARSPAGRGKRGSRTTDHEKG